MVKRQGKDWLVLDKNGTIIGRHKEMSAALKQHREYDGSEQPETKIVPPTGPKPKPQRKPRSKKAT